MQEQKIENLLNLSLDASRQERAKSSELSTGFDERTDTWDLIVKYSGDIRRIESESIHVVVLMNGYAIITVPEAMIDSLSEIPEIIFIEKPKSLYFSLLQGIAASCINPVQTARYNLFGDGIIVGVIDSGIDYSHPVFRNADGSTRIIEIWDQTIAGKAPEGYNIGTLYTREDINNALDQSTMEGMLRIVPSQDLSGHGTHVACIAAGNIAQDRNSNQGIATKSELIIVKLGNPRTGSFPRTSELMQAVDYVVKRAMDLNKPLALNISFGNTYGSHDGASLLETFIDSAADQGKTSIVIASGNEGSSAGHTSGILNINETAIIELAISDYEQSLSVQIWKSYVDEFDIEITDPSGNNVIVLSNNLGPQRFNVANTTLLVYYGEPKPYVRYQEIYIEFIADQLSIDSGIWRIGLVPRRIVYGRYDMWLPSEGSLNEQTRFLRPNVDTTLTIPSTAEKAITVGAYNSSTLSYADFSGRGYTRTTNQVKPDLVAPGVNVRSAIPGGGFDVKSGTSMAAPFVTGSAALLMEWGITRGNDPFLYGEKLKAYLLRGAKHLPGYGTFPNPQLGWGALCVRDSLP